MNEQEMIEQWKKNEKPFGLCSKEMQEYLLRIAEKKGLSIQVYCEDGRWCVVDIWTEPLNAQITYRLHPDYQPEVIEVEIRNGVLTENVWIGEFKYGLPNHIVSYPHAPAVHAIGDDKNPVRFAGYKYADGVISEYPTRLIKDCDTYLDLMFPIAALFVRVK